MDADEEWETAAIAQLKADVRAYPGGARGFVDDHKDRLGISYGAFNDNLNGSGRIAYRTYTRAVAILGFTPEQYDRRIADLIESQRRQG